MKKSSTLCFLACFLVIIFAVPILIFWRGNQKTVSYYENRALNAKPTFTEESLLSGDYFGAWDKWLSDHITGRATLLSLKTQLDMNLLRRPVVNGVVVSSDVLLPYYADGRWDLSYLDAQATRQGDALAALDAQISAYGGHFYYLGLPHQSSYFSDHYPAYLSSRQWHVDGITKAFSAALAARDISFLDMAPVYAADGNPERYYSPTDHHFTYYGAVKAYRAMMEQINRDRDEKLTIPGDEDLVLSELPNPYLGSQNRKLYGLWHDDEKLVIGNPVNEIPFTRIDNGVDVPATLFDFPETDAQAVTYNLYMGGDVAETVIRTDRPELPSALIFGDSFTNPLETLFYSAFDETRSLDLRYYTAQSLREYMDEYRPDIVICVRDNTVYLSADGNGAIGES